MALFLSRLQKLTTLRINWPLSTINETNTKAVGNCTAKMKLAKLELNLRCGTGNAGYGHLIPDSKDLSHIHLVFNE